MVANLQEYDEANQNEEKSKRSTAKRQNKENQWLIEGVKRKFNLSDQLAEGTQRKKDRMPKSALGRTRSENRKKI